MCFVVCVLVLEFGSEVLLVSLSPRTRPAHHRRAISDIRLEMVSVVHKLHIFNGHWEMLSNEYATLKASLALFCTEPRPEAPEVIPLLPGVEL